MQLALIDAGLEPGQIRFLFRRECRNSKTGRSVGEDGEKIGPPAARAAVDERKSQAQGASASERRKHPARDAHQPACGDRSAKVPPRRGYLIGLLPDPQWPEVRPNPRNDCKIRGRLGQFLRQFTHVFWSLPLNSWLAPCARARGSHGGRRLLGRDAVAPSTSLYASVPRWGRW